MNTILIVAVIMIGILWLWCMFDGFYDGKWNALKRLVNRFRRKP